MKFWNLQKLDEKTAELSVFGEIVSEKPWFTEDITDYRDFIKELNSLGDVNIIKV